MRYRLFLGLRRRERNTRNCYGKPDSQRYFFALQTRLISDYDLDLGGPEEAKCADDSKEVRVYSCLSYRSEDPW
jgi:hypothetical protein